MQRRDFLTTAGAVTLGFTGLRNFLACGEMRKVGYGRLIPDPNNIFDLPKGFSYKVISRHGQEMTDGFFVPQRPDGMAAFPGPNGTTIVVRNHEVNPDAEPGEGAFGKNYELLSRLQPNALYDGGSNGKPSLGGTTTLVYDTRKQKLLSQYLSLPGTLRNCAGGPTPWNSWLTCEEISVNADAHFAQSHGYVFEVPASAEVKLASPVPLKAMGRFVHEAVAVHPSSGIVYETEDQHDGLFYRFIPAKPQQLSAGGKLQALCIADQVSFDTRNWDKEHFKPGSTLAVRWIDLDDVDSANNDLRLRGFAKGAACFARGEGAWYGNDAIYFACTSGGRLKKGQIWRYIPSPSEGTAEETANPGKLELFAEPNDASVIEHADNLTVAPWGDLIICEDGVAEQFLVGITPKGEFYQFGKNAMSDSELAGATFSPDGSTLFVNIQHDGLTLAISGRW